MPTWGGILNEIKAERAKKPAPTPGTEFDIVRRRYLKEVAKTTGRNVVLYATAWTQPGSDPQLTSVTMEDLQGLMEVFHGLAAAKGVDLILHSPGGSAEAAEAIVNYMRSKFSDVRVIVPHAAMSAATMLACSGDRLLMGKHSFLGPIDPQFILSGGDVYTRVAPAHAIMEQFKFAQDECAKNPAKIATWLPILRSLGPSLLMQCRYHTDLAESLVGSWLAKYMLSGHPDAVAKAEAIAKTLNNHDHFKSHSRFIPREELKTLGLVVDDLESDQQLQDLVLSVYHAATHTFSGTGVAVQKIIENNWGKAFIKSQQIVQFQAVKAGGAGSFALPMPPMLAS
ncbi:protein of unknown function DUF114 [Anaeromyxobacter dehalogenans 2CP-1]|uniref:Serine protease n=1 Tax=Anaeromyxobacter dehalogenans (strain ATCC BAA-258 / DSM 21875 / 2CP-1) TaxID=455488 RepID=B8JHP2_ANAD2|nr:ATP-dependent Clp protease proteolytic subunit [Anaeromyxobacter dehalogenans]ACL66754.1 protein of unknown function DUF114 [Anaeromyxobacter dehalogenans 2CP-1]